MLKPSGTPFLPFLAPFVAILLLFLFGPCFFTLLVKFTSSRLQQSHIQLMLTRGFSPHPLGTVFSRQD